MATWHPGEGWLEVTSYGDPSRTFLHQTSRTILQIPWETRPHKKSQEISEKCLTCCPGCGNLRVSARQRQAPSD